MIRTLVVDDDFMAASVHASFTERVGGFEVVGQATSGTEALALVEKLRPDLMLLDIYLPDLSGLEVMRRLRAMADVDVDVIAITSAKDVNVVRSAIQHGVVHYLVKPFSFQVFRERLESYAALTKRLERIDDADQNEVDRLYALLRTRRENALPKGISAPTLQVVASIVRESETGLSAAAVAERSGISRATVRRYLEFLADAGTIELSLRYGSAGRPEHLYGWTGSPG